MAKWGFSRGAESRYARELRKVARVIGNLIKSHVSGSTIRDQTKLQAMLKAYSEAITPWAEKTSAKFIGEISRGNQKAFAAQSKKIAAALKQTVNQTDVGAAALLLQQRQVALIKSLPLEAGERAQKLAMEAATGGRRADEIAEELARTEGVTESRATLIARTEIAKANSAITQARAEYVGADSYIWRTAEDGDVRESHRQMNGKVFKFKSPPTLSDGTTGNPGEFPNCRCFAEPIIPD